METTHLEFLTLGTLLDAEQESKRIRDKINFRKTLPAFYQLMARLEEAGFVRGRDEQLVIDGQPVKRRWYAITDSGKVAYFSQ